MDMVVRMLCCDDVKVITIRGTTDGLTHRSDGPGFNVRAHATLHSTVSVHRSVGWLGSCSVGR